MSLYTISKNVRKVNNFVNSLYEADSQHPLLPRPLPWMAKESPLLFWRRHPGQPSPRVRPQTRHRCSYSHLPPPPPPSPFWSPSICKRAHYHHGLIGRELWNHYIGLPAEKRIKPTQLSQFWHIFIIKVSRNCDLPSRNEIFLTNQFSILLKIEQKVAVRLG